MMLGGWIGGGAPIAWPSKSPDLTEINFFLRCYVKNLVYQVNSIFKYVVAVLTGNKVIPQLHNIRCSASLCPSPPALSTEP